MNGLRRRKRDSATNIYRHCKIFGTCPPDVTNKVENNTLADKILKWGSGAVYLGGLGIGTGTANFGVEAGSTAVGSDIGVTIGREVPIPRPFEPTGAIDPVVPRPGINETPFGPANGAPVDVVPGGGVVEPSDPSVLIPEDVPPEVVDTAISQPVPSITFDGDNTAIIEVTPRTPENRIISRTQYDNPTFDITLFSNNTAGEISAGDQVTVNGGGGIFVGDPLGTAAEGEEIPLLELSPVSRNTGSDLQEEETGFSTSTPESNVRTRTRARPGQGLYSRGVEQVRVYEPEFIEEPRRLVSFDFVNPAYDPEVTQIFEEDLRAADQSVPSISFRDVVRLGRVQLNRARSGLVRVSRLGQRANMTTRSGLRIGARTHFYLDLSPVVAEEPLEEIPLAEFNNESTVVDALAEGEAADEETALLDEYEESNRINVQLMVDAVTPDMEFEETLLDIPEEVRRPNPLYPGIEFTGYTVESATASGDIVPREIIPIDIPAITISADSDTYYLHPSLTRKRKRRRKYVFVYY